jgi:MFS family permease
VTDARPATLGNRAVLRLPEFRKLFVAQAISDAGDGMTFMALLFLVNALTHSPAVLAGLSIAVAVPSMVGGVVAGAVADRFDRRRIMIASDALRAVLVLGFVVAGTVERLPILFVLAFVQAAIGTLFTPARGALIPRVVPVEGLMAANGLSQMARMIAALVGSSTTGVLFAVTGNAWPVFIIDAATFLASVLIVSRVDPRLGTPAVEPHEIASGFASSVTAGLRVIAGSRTLLATVTGLSFAMLGLGAINILFVPFLVDVLHETPAWAGPIEGAQTLSMVLAAGLIGTIAARLSAQSMIFMSLTGVAALILFLSVAPNVWVLLVLLFLAGWFVMPLQAATQTIVQITTADAIRGRVLGALNALTSTTTIVSTAAAGVFASAIGVREVIFLGGLVVLGAALLSGSLFWLEKRSTPVAAAPAIAAEG